MQIVVFGLLVLATVIWWTCAALICELTGADTQLAWTLGALCVTVFTGVIVFVVVGLWELARHLTQ